MKSPSNWHADYREMIEKAQRELDRFNAATTQQEMKDAIEAFCLKAGPIVDWVFERDIKGKAQWRGYDTPHAFRAWLKERCHAIAQLASADVMYKHERIDGEKHDRQLDELSVSAGSVVSLMGSPSDAITDAYLRGTVVTREELIDTDSGPAVLASYEAPKFLFGADRRRFLDVAESAIKFWRSFDPMRGANQVI